MWYKIDWAEANSLTTTRTKYIQAIDLVTALKLVAMNTLSSEVHGCCYVLRVAGPPSKKED